MKKIILASIVLLFTVHALISTDHTKQAYEDRYQAIKPLLKKYKRPMTILEIGGNQHGLTFTIAQHYNAVCCLAEPTNYDAIQQQCVEKNYENVVVLAKELSLKNLERLSECEHFDVVYIWNLLDLYPETWQEAVDIFLTFGNHIIIESPSDHAHDNVKNYLVKQQGKLLNSAEKLCLFMFTREKSILPRNHWKAQSLQRPGFYKIKSTFAEKLFIKKDTIITQFEPGINLLTFKQLRGTYPTNVTIRNLLEPFKYSNLRGVNIHNLIIKGNWLTPIDCTTLDQPDPLAEEKIVKIINEFQDPT